MLAHLRYSARGFARTPGLALALLLTIALGIGSNAAVLGFMRGVGAREVPYPALESAVSVYARDTHDGFGPLAYDTFVSVAARTDVFETVGAARESQGTMELETFRLGVAVAAISPELAAILQLPLDRGVVISDQLLRRDFRSVPDVVGLSVRIEGTTTRIAAVAPPTLEGLFTGRQVDVWVPIDGDALGAIDRGTRTFWVIARLRPDVSIARARSLLDTDAAAALAVLPYTGVTPDVDSGLSRIVRLLPAAAAAVFFIACANVAAFLLSRATSRSQETSVRVALGAGRAQLIALLAADSVLISIIGGAAGGLLALWTADAVPALFFQEDAEHLIFAPDVSGILTAAAACAAITMLCGLLPLAELRHDNPAAVLRREAGGLSNAMRRVRAGLVIAQMTCCCVLTISTGMLLHGFRASLQTASGARLEPHVMATLESRSDRPLEYFRAAEKAVLPVPGVETAAWAAAIPGSRPRWRRLRVEPAELPVREVELDVQLFTPDRFDEIVMPPLAGRMFGIADAPFGCRVGIVNQDAAGVLFGGEAVGRSIVDPAGEAVEIVGVVASRVGPGTPRPAPTVYFYGEQVGAAFQSGPTPFRVPVLPDRAADGVLNANVVSAEYFDAMGFGVSAGRMFSNSAHVRECRVAVVNQQAAELHFGGRAVGAAVIDGLGRRTRIVGVVHSPLLRTSQRPMEPSIYFPVAQDVELRMTLLLGARTVDDAMLTAVRRELDGVAGGTAEPVVTTLEAHLSRTALAPERIATLLMGASAATALALGVLGMYGAMADSVRRRRREFALRIALGAQSWRVMTQVLSEGLRLAAAGALGGLAVSLLIAQLLARLSPAAGALNLWAAIAGLIVLVGAVAIASVLPTRRALTADPLSIMRDN